MSPSYLVHSIAKIYRRVHFTHPEMLESVDTIRKLIHFGAVRLLEIWRQR